MAPSISPSMSNEIPEQYPRTSLTPSSSHHSSARRTIEIRHLVDKNAARGETYGTEIIACHVESHQSDGGAFSPPRVYFGCNGAALSSFSRAEWERIKREVDQAFDAFERTWPLVADEADNVGPVGFAEQPK